MMTINATDATFETDVLLRSTQVPVVVDLWAEWCGPCRTLGPILESAVAGTGGRVELAKVDVDSNPNVAATFQVQSIPAVFAIRDRSVVDSFLGAQPEPQVREFVERLAPPATEADRLAATGDEDSLRQALELQPDNGAAVTALANLLIDRGDNEEALGLLGRLPETPEIRLLAARARVGDDGAAGGEPPDVENRLDDLLGRVREDSEARQQYVDLLELLGPDDPRTPRYRRALASRLF